MTDATTNSFILQQIKSLEERLDVHSKKLEDKLDDLVRLMTVVAQLQERDIHQAENIRRTETNISALFTELRQHELSDRTIHSELTEKVQLVKSEVDEYKHKGWGVWKGLTAFFFVLQLILGSLIWSIENTLTAKQEALTKIEHRLAELEHIQLQMQTQLQTKK